MPRTPTPKQPRPAKSPAPKRKESPAAEPKQERAELSKTHELIVDSVTDMLTHGGPAGEVDRLITAAMRYRWRTMSYSIETGSDERAIGEFIRNNFEEWKTDLTVYWRRNQRSAPGSFEAETITGRIRENVRAALWEGCVNFINSAAPEEQHIMEQILSFWQSSSGGAVLRNDEIALGDAFNLVLGKDGTLIKVPSRMVDQVQKYVDALRAVEGKAA